MPPGTPLPKVSVAVCAYNGERFLEQQLESLARQTVPPAELLVCDDCSSDGTPAILRRFSRTAPFRVRIFRNERNLGFNESFFRLANRCESRLVAFCDQDDVWSEDKIEACGRCFAEHPEVRLVMHAGQPVDEDQRPPSRDLDGRAMDFDEWLYWLAWAVGEIGFVHDRLVQYRQHGSNLFGAPVPGWRVRLRALATEDFATAVGRGAAAQAYAEVLERAAGANDAVRPRLLAGARYWRAYEELSRRRDGLYEARSVGERLRRVCRLIAARAYRSRESGGLGRSALIRDLREVVLSRRGAAAVPA